jgi:hypothetical protein
MCFPKPLLHPTARNDAPLLQSEAGHTSGKTVEKQCKNDKSAQNSGFNRKQM